MRTLSLKKVGLFLLMTCAVFITWGYWVIFGTWPIISIKQVTRITDIHFPASAKLIAGDDIHNGPSQIALAKVEMPLSDLATFQSQPNMSAFQSSSPSQIDPTIAQMFQQRGWSLNGVKNLEKGEFHNGSRTLIWIDKDAPQVAKVYIHFDEP